MKGWGQTAAATLLALAILAAMVVIPGWIDARSAPTHPPLCTYKGAGGTYKQPCPEELPSGDDQP